MRTLYEHAFRVFCLAEHEAFIGQFIVFDGIMNITFAIHHRDGQDGFVDCDICCSCLDFVKIAVRCEDPVHFMDARR